MTIYVEAIEDFEYLITKGKIYEVCEDRSSYFLEDNNGDFSNWPKQYFKEVEEPTKETNAFKFIPETEIQYVTVNGVKGILIKE